MWLDAREVIYHPCAGWGTDCRAYVANPEAPNDPEPRSAVDGVSSGAVLGDGGGE
jgi:hypothetical protein